MGGNISLATTTNKMDSSTSIKGKEHPSSSTKHSNSVPPAFSGTTLEQVLQFVLPEDVARASMVCKTWQDDLKKPPPITTTTPKKKKTGAHDAAAAAAPSAGVVMNSMAIWKQTVTNSSPNVIQALVDATSTSTTTSGDGGDKQKQASQIDFLALAKGGLGLKRKKPELPEPTLRIEDVLVVCEFKQVIYTEDETGEELITTSVKSLGALCCKGSEEMLTVNGEDGCGRIEFDLKQKQHAGIVVVEGYNPLCLDTYNGNMRRWEDAKIKFHKSIRKEARRGREGTWENVELPFVKASEGVLDNLMVSITLFRTDDWRSFSFFDDARLDDNEYETSSTSTSSQVDCCVFGGWGKTGGSPFARNAFGSVAHEVLEAKQISTMLADMQMTFECKLPGTPGGATPKEEPAWLQKFRKKPADTTWTGQDYDEIAQLKTFQFNLDSLSINMGHDDSGGDAGFRDRKGFLLLLEGLDWQ